MVLVRSTSPKFMGMLHIIVVLVIAFSAQPSAGQYYCDGRTAITAQWGGCNGTYAVCSYLMQAITTTWNWWSGVNNTNGSSLGVAVHNFFTTDAYGELLIITNNNTAYPTTCKKIAAIVGQLLIWNATKDATVLLGNATYAATARQELFDTAVPGWGYTIGQYVACGINCTNSTSTTSSTTTRPITTSTTTSRTATTTPTTTNPTTTTTIVTTTTTHTATASPRQLTTTSTALLTTTTSPIMTSTRTTTLATTTTTPTTTSTMPSTTTTTSTTAACIAPGNVSGIVIEQDLAISIFDSTVVGVCSCDSGNGGLNVTYFAVVDDTLIYSGLIGTITLFCVPENQQQMCACDAQGVCYEVTDATNSTVDFVQVFNSCAAAGGGCLNYLVLDCYDYSNDTVSTTSGLSNVATGELVWTCAQQGGPFPALHSSLPIVKPVSVSCGSCVNATEALCSGEYTPRLCLCNESPIVGIGSGSPATGPSAALSNGNCPYMLQSERD